MRAHAGAGKPPVTSWCVVCCFLCVCWLTGPGGGVVTARAGRLSGTGLQVEKSCGGRVDARCEGRSRGLQVLQFEA